MKVKKRGNYRTLEEYVKYKTGRSIAECNTFSNQNIMHLQEVADMISSCVKNKIPIWIFGDYDCDGITSVVILCILMKYLGAEYHLVIPARSDGYGISEKQIDRIPENVLLITVDNGISAVGAIKKAKEKGMKVIILDHHLNSEVIPEADIIVDPEAFPNKADFDGYCGAGLSYKLCELMIKDETTLKYANAFAAVGTVADVVPLLEDNRRIVKNGLSIINSGCIPAGLKILCRIMAKGAPVTSENISFYEAPAINAAGRLVDKGGQFSAKAIYCNNQSQAEELVAKLVGLNKQRKDLVEESMNSVVKTLGEPENVTTKNIFVKGDFHPGLIGLIAGKLAEKYSRPAFVMTEKNGIMTGSFRSDDEDVNHGKKMLDTVSDLLLKYGGHAGAAGFSFKKENFDAISAALEKYPVVPHDDAYYYDFEINSENLQELLEQMDEAEPFGKLLEKPVIKIKLALKGGCIQYMSNDEHVKFKFGKNSEAVYWNYGKQYKKDGEPKEITIYGSPEWNYYRGVKPSFKIERYEKS